MLEKSNTLLNEMKEKHQDTSLVDKNDAQIQAILDEVKATFKKNEKALKDIKGLWFKALTEQESINQT